MSTLRRFVGQAIVFLPQICRTVACQWIRFVYICRRLFSFHETVVKDGSEAHYTDSIHLLARYFVKQKKIASHVKPIFVREFC